MNTQQRKLSLLLLCCFSINAQQVQEIRPISFGTVAVLDNDVSGSIDIDELGNVVISTNFAVIDLPLHGEYQLIDYPVNANVFLSGGILQAQTTSTEFSPEQFTLTSVNVPSVVNIGNDGTAVFRAGGTLETSGSGSLSYGDTSYTSRIIITVNF